MPQRALPVATHLSHPPRSVVPGQTGSHNPPTQEPVTPPPCSRPSFPWGFPPGAQLPQGPIAADSTRGTPVSWPSFGAGSPWVRRAPTPAGQGAQTWGCPLPSLPPQEGSAAIPATGSSARAVSLAAWHSAGGGGAWGTGGSEDAPFSPQHGRRGCPCPHGPRRGKGGDTRLCPGSWWGTGEIWRTGRAWAACPPPHTERFPLLRLLLA